MIVIWVIMGARTCALIRMVITTVHATMDLLSEMTERLVKKVTAVVLSFFFWLTFLKP